MKIPIMPFSCATLDVSLLSTVTLYVRIYMDCNKCCNLIGQSSVSNQLTCRITVST